MGGPSETPLWTLKSKEREKYFKKLRKKLKKKRRH